MNTYKLSPTDMRKEKGIIQQILINNKYDPFILEKIKHKKKQQKQEAERKKWAKFTYIGRETKFIIKIFKSTNIRIAFSTNNTVERLLKTRQEKLRLNTTNQVYTNYNAQHVTWST